MGYGGSAAVQGAFSRHKYFRCVYTKFKTVTRAETQYVVYYTSSYYCTTYNKWHFLQQPLKRQPDTFTYITYKLDNVLSHVMLSKSAVFFHMIKTFIGLRFTQAISKTRASSQKWVASQHCQLLLNHCLMSFSFEHCLHRYLCTDEKDINLGLKLTQK